MTAEHARFADWDAAYLLGALSAADRRAFEEHLESCERCVRAVAEVAPTLGLLARVDPASARSLQQDETEPAPAGAVARGELLARAAREARRRRSRWTGGLAAAAVLVVALAVGLVTALAPPAGDRTVELAAVVDAPLTATAELDAVAWGTRLDVECRYGGDGEADASPGVPYALVVTGRDGSVSAVSSWRAAPGATARLAAATAMALDDIATVEIRMEDTGEVLMRAELGDG